MIIWRPAAIPATATVKGAELAVTTWDMLSGAVEPAENILIYDGTGQHHAPSCAEFLAKRGALVEIATQDRMVGEEVGATNQPIHLRELYKLGVVLSPNLQLTEIYREGNKLVAVLRNEFTHEEEERLVDQVVVEFGTLPNDALYFDLKERSINRGEMDLHALRRRPPAAPQSQRPRRLQPFTASATASPAATSTRRSTTPPACARTCESPMIASTLSAIVIITLASGLALALVQARRWRAGKAADVDLVAGLKALPRRYLVDVHDVVERKPFNSRFHALTAGGFLASLALIVLLAIPALRHWTGLGSAQPGARAMLAGGLMVGWRRRVEKPPELSKGRFSRLPFALLAYAAAFLVVALDQAAGGVLALAPQPRPCPGRSLGLRRTGARRLERPAEACRPRSAPLGRPSAPASAFRTAWAATPRCAPRPRSRRKLGAETPGRFRLEPAARLRRLRPVRPLRNRLPGLCRRPAAQSEEADPGSGDAAWGRSRRQRLRRQRAIPAAPSAWPTAAPIRIAGHRRRWSSRIPSGPARPAAPACRNAR